MRYMLCLLRLNLTNVLRRCLTAFNRGSRTYVMLAACFALSVNHVYAKEEIIDSGPDFVDITKQSKIDFLHHPAIYHKSLDHLMPILNAAMVGGAVADFDNDGFLDIFVADTLAGYKAHLYHNNGDLTFTDIAQRAGVADVNDKSNASTSAMAFDYDGDGWQDLLVARFGTPILFKNKGDGTFVDVTKKAGLKHHMNTIHSIAFDYNKDGHIDIYLGNYYPDVDMFNLKSNEVLHDSWENARNGGKNVFYQNNGDGTFTARTEQLGLGDTGWTVALGHSDLDNDGWQDIYVANDYGPDKVFRNTGKGGFEDITDEAIGVDGKHGMSAEIGDFNNDGFFDIYVTNITEEWAYECNMLWQNNGDGTFTDVATELNVCDTGWAWGAKFFDYDNDGDLDLYVANGFVAGEGNYMNDLTSFLLSDIGQNPSDPKNWPAVGNKGMAANENNQLFTNLDGLTFIPEKRGGLNIAKYSRAVLMGDFDNDGRLDLFLTNLADKAQLFQNKSLNDNNWIELDLAGLAPNRDAVGARIEVMVSGNTFVREVNIGNGFAGSSMIRQHFGLGKNKVIDKLVITWPNGDKQIHKNVVTNKMYRARQKLKDLKPIKY